MAIYNPDLFFSRTDLELLRLLEQLILSWNATDQWSNVSSTEIPLSQLEASLLLELLEEFLESKKFIESAYLIEGLFGGSAFSDARLREIYLSWRIRVGRTRAIASVQWEELLRRIGLVRGAPDQRVWYRASATPMTIEYFKQMELKLADAANVHPRVKALIMQVIHARAAYLDDLRAGQTRLESGIIAEKPKSLVASLKGSDRKVGTAPMSSSKLAGILIIVMDFSALYTTRDWSVAAFFSTIAGATAPAILD